MDDNTIPFVVNELEEVAILKFRRRSMRTFYARVIDPIVFGCSLPICHFSLRRCLSTFNQPSDAYSVKNHSLLASIVPSVDSMTVRTLVQRTPSRLDMSRPHTVFVFMSDKTASEDRSRLIGREMLDAAQ